VDGGTLRFEISKPKISWGTYFQDLIRPKFGGGFKSYSGAGPSIVAENGTGEKHVVEVATTMKEAENRVAIIEQDFDALSLSEWCARYDVPVAFVTG
jgi:hypothetical protein